MNKPIDLNRVRLERIQAEIEAEELRLIDTKRYDEAAATRLMKRARDAALAYNRATRGIGC